MSRFPVVALLLLAALARLLLIGHESYWFDEIWALKQARSPLIGLLASLAEEDVHPPLYPVLLWGWVRLVGEAEWATRLLSAIAGVGAVGFLFLLGRDLYDRKTGLLAAAILAVHATAVDFSQETRAYSLMLMLAVASGLTLVRWADRPSRSSLTAWIAAAIALSWVHVYGLFVLAGQGLWLLWKRPQRRRSFVLAAGLVAVAFAPWVPFLVRQIGRVQEGFWIDPLDWTDPVRWWWHWSGYSIPAAIVLALLVARGSMERSRDRSLLLLWVLVPVGVPVLVSLLAEPIVHPKYPIAILAPIALLAARGVLGLPRPELRRGIGAVLMVLLVLGLTTKIYLRTSREQYRELAELAVKEGGRGVVVFAEASARPYLTWYLPDDVAVWVGGDGDVDGVEARARAGVRELLFLLVHPKTSVREPALGARWELVEEVTFVEARAVRYRIIR